MTATATHPGVVTYPGTSIGLRGELEAEPQTENGIVLLDDGITVGPAYAQTDATGTLQGGGLKVPIVTGLLWRLLFRPFDDNLGGKLDLGVYNLNTSGVAIEDLVVADFVTIDESVRLDIASAASLGATNNTATASFVGTTGATQTALDTRFARNGGEDPRKAAYGAAANGTADDRGALAAADTAAVAAGTFVSLPSGRYKVSSNLTINSAVALSAGAKIEPAAGVTVTINGRVAAGAFAQAFAGAGNVKLGKAQVVDADWWGGKGTNAAPTGTIQAALTNTAQGTTIRLAGKYWQTPIQVFANEDTLTGDLSKSLVGIASPGIRSTSTSGEWGAEVYLGDTQNADLLWLNGTQRSNLQPSRISFTIDNVKLNGNKANNATGGQALRLSWVKDIYLGRILLESANDRGMYVSAACNQVIARHVEAMSNNNHGIDLAALGDSHFDMCLGGSNGGHGVVVAGGVQINQIHQYLNGNCGVSVSGDKVQLGLVRCNDNGNGGIVISAASNYAISSAIVVDNGTNTGSTTALRSGIRLTGLSTSGKINHVNAANAATGTQQYGVRFDTGLTGSLNQIGSYHGANNVLAEVSGAVVGTNWIETVNGVANISGTAYAPAVVYKGADEVVNNSNTFQADDHLFKAIGASEDHDFEFTITYDADTAADLKVQVNGPAGSTVAFTVQGPAVGLGAAAETGSGTFNYDALAGAQSIGAAGVGTKTTAIIKGWIRNGGTSGNLSLSWAQSTATATNATVYALGSRLLTQRTA